MYRRDSVITAPFLLEQIKNWSPEDEYLLRQMLGQAPVLGQPAVQDSANAPMKGRLVGVLRHPRHVAIPPHRHSYVEMMFVCSGTVVHQIGGQQVTLHAGDFLLMNQYTTHSVLPCGENDVSVNFIIDPHFFDETYELAAQRTVLSDLFVELVRSSMHCNHYLHFEAGMNLPLCHLAEIMLCHFFPHNDEHSRCRAQDIDTINNHLMFLVFYYLTQDLEQLNDDAPFNYEKMLIETVEQYINKTYRTATLRELAGMLNQSESGLSRQIKLAIGATFKELLQGRRFDRALVLLVQTNLSVSDIALSVGYENSSYFYRRFREIYHISPKIFRSQMREKEKPNWAEQ